MTTEVILVKLNSTRDSQRLKGLKISYVKRNNSFYFS